MKQLIEQIKQTGLFSSIYTNRTSCYNGKFTVKDDTVIIKKSNHYKTVNINNIHHINHNHKRYTK